MTTVDTNVKEKKNPMRGTVLALLALVGCAVEPPADQPLTPLPAYPAWYQEVETCAGERGDYGGLRFFLLDADDPHGGITFGQDIWLRYADSQSRLVVEHEMLHSLIGDGDHGDPRWVGCGLHPDQLRAALLD